jgi:hypothetical protein
VAGTLHRRNALVAAVLLAASLPFGPAVVAGVALGCAVQAVNLLLLERSVSLMLGLAGAGQGGGVQALVALRFVALMGVCAGILIALPLPPVAFAAGFSSAVPAVLWHGLASRGDQA